MYRPPILFPFLPGHAVYHGTHGRRVASLPTYTPGVVTSVSAKLHYQVQLASGRSITTRGSSLAFAGHCPACERPAVVRAGALVCERCNGPAGQLPPVALAARWLPPGHVHHAVAVYELANGATTMQQLRAAWWRQRAIEHTQNRRWAA